MIKEINFTLRSDQEYIQLIQLLKATNVADSGAFAQEIVLQKKVKRNGEIELRKRAKILRGETIEVESFVIHTH